MRRRIVAIAFALCALASAARAQYVPLDSRAYRDLDALAVRGWLVVPATTTKPFSRTDVLRGLAKLGVRRAAMSPYERQIFDRLSASLLPFAADENWWLAFDANPRIVAATDVLPVLRPRADRLPANANLVRDPRITPYFSDSVATDRVRSINTLDVALRPHREVAVAARLELDTDGTADADYAGRIDTYALGSTGQFEEAYALWEPAWGTVAAGRIPRAWGPGRAGNVHLSENAPAADAIALGFDVRWVHFTAFTGELNPDATADGRFMVGHRIVLAPFPWIEIGGGETLLYGGDRGFSFWRSNPFAALYVEEVNSATGGGNGYAAFDVTLRPRRGVETYVEVAIDDYSLDKTSPHHMGWTAGLRWEAPLGWDRAGFGAEYSRISRWIYNYANAALAERYVNRRGIMGHFLGPDGDALFLDGRWESERGIRVALLGTYRRRGATRVWARYPVDDAGGDFGYRDEPFPSGTVERTVAGELTVELPPYHGATVSLSLIGATVENPANDALRPGRRELAARLDLDWRLPVALR